MTFGRSEKVIILKLVGDKKLVKKFENLKRRAKKTVFRAATRSGVSVLRKQIKKDAPKDTGQLKRSVHARVKTYPSKGVYIGVAGIKKDSKSKDTGRNPANYLHLVEEGYSKPGGRVEGTHFMRKAFNKSKSAAESTFKKKAAEAIEREFKKAQ